MIKLGIFNLLNNRVIKQRRKLNFHTLFKWQINSKEIRAWVEKQLLILRPSTYQKKFAYVNEIDLLK